MIAIPAPAADPRNMADWREARALVAADRDASISDLRRALVALGSDSAFRTGTGPGRGDEDERLALDAWTELADRAKACRNAYPFEIENSTLRVKPDVKSHWAYVFCLSLSLKGAN